ncbi:hypothetical protein DUNSADRAFT_1169 [Dunaliella salina]|uniref:Uncharacterized protein n=1 Tax=Dunaliella salina TaxID=3046 RepID=A0ABQ7GXH0_DUNSA|nr:hypothetical protein DUNSADRAFT_1169 [Dunaliella salina]|eukprot:KAF5839296.1 hypothetical protein DUNSADRAFT_1169 [Dunaliella salina]
MQRSAKCADEQPQDKHKVTRDLILALEQLQATANSSKPKQDLASACYVKLHFDFPLVGAAEVNALADLVQHCLELKMGAGLGPLSKYLVTAKFVDNIVHGAKQPPPLPAPTSAGLVHTRIAPSSSSSSSSAPLPASSLASNTPHAAPEPPLSAANTAAAAAKGAASGDASAASLLRAAYQRLCTYVLLRYTAVALRVPEWDAQRMFAAYEVPHAENDEEEVRGRSGLCKDGGMGPAGLDGDEGAADKGKQGGSLTQTQHLSHSDGGTGSNEGCARQVVNNGVEAAEPDPDDFEFEPLEEPAGVPIGNGSHEHCHHIAPPQGHTGHASLSAPSPQHSCATHALRPCISGATAAAAAAEVPGRQGSWGELLRKLHALVSPDNLDALMPAAGTGEAAARSSSTSTTTASSIHPTTTPAKSLSSNGAASKTSWGSSSSEKKATNSANHGRDEGMGSSSAAAAAADVDAWRLSDTGGALMELLRSIGVHAHAADLQPMLQACVALLGRRLAAHPEEMAAGLQQLWDTLGVCGVASMPPAPQGYSTGGTAAGGQQQQHQQNRLVLAPEANIALTLLADLASCHISSQGRTALWRHINLHTLPVLKRCLEDVAAARQVSPDTLAAVTLISKVVLFYLEHAPGGFNAPSALLSAGVVRGLAVALPRFGPLPDAHELRTAVLLCASGSPEVCSWVAAVPGVSATLSGPAFQLGSWGEAHGALWQLLTATHSPIVPNGAPVSMGKQAGALTSPSSADGSQQGPGRGQAQGVLLMVALLESGMGCSSLSELQRMHAALELLLRAWQQSGRRRFWGAAVDAALRTALGTLKHALTAPSGRPSLPEASQAAGRAQQEQASQSHRMPGHRASDKYMREAPADALINGNESLQAANNEGVQAANNMGLRAASSMGLSAANDVGLPAVSNSQPLTEQRKGALAVGFDAAAVRGIGIGDRVLGGGKGQGGASLSDVKGDDKAHGLDVGELEARSVQRMGGACMKLLKEILMTENKMD